LAVTMPTGPIGDRPVGGKTLDHKVRFQCRELGGRLSRQRWILHFGNAF
jgi:hypothetical protein